MIEVLHIVGGLHLRGGAETVAKRLAVRELTGVRQRVWMHRDFEGGDDEGFVCGGVAEEVNASLGKDLFAAVREAAALCGWLDDKRDCVLHAHSRVGVFAAFLVGFWLGVPVVHHCHALPRHVWFYDLLGRLCRHWRVYNSAKTCRHFGADSERSTIVWPDIDWPDGPGLRRQGGVRFVTAGSFVPGKHLKEIIAAFRLWRQGGQDGRLVLFGRSPNPGGYEREVLALCEGDEAVEVCGWDRNWMERLSPDDVFVHAGQPESFGLTMLEAFARGSRMVVLADTFLDELPEGIADRGIERVGGYTPDQLAMAMARAVSIPWREEMWSCRAAEKVRFGGDGADARLAELYRECAAA